VQFWRSCLASDVAVASVYQNCDAIEEFVK